MLDCLSVAVTPTNPSVGQLQVTIGVTNTCPADVSSPITWAINGTNTCAGDTQNLPPPNTGQYQAPSGNTLLVKGQVYNIVSVVYPVVCIVNGVQSPWSTTVTADVTGQMLYSIYDAAYGIGTNSVQGLQSTTR